LLDLDLGLRSARNHRKNPTLSSQIQLLGGLSLSHAGQPVSLPARKSEALLAVLAVRPGVAFERQWLAGLLWPNVAEPQARTSLRQALGHVRKSLAAALIAGSADRIHLDPKAVQVDTAELQRLFALAPSEREPALALLRGPLLEGFPALEEPFDHWLYNERTRLAERTAAALQECLAALSAAGHVERALAVGQRLVELDPSAEATHRALMRLHAERGDRSAALRQYQHCRELLRQQLDVEPSAETERLKETLSRLSVAPPAPEPAPASVRAPDSEGRWRIAVLPFTALSETNEARVLAAALTEDVSTELLRFRQLALVARTRMAPFAKEPIDLLAIARETAARLVLSGSVRALPGRVRVTAALFDTSSGLELWAERWDAADDDWLSAADRLTRSVVGALALRIDESRLGRARRKPRERLEAYECWLSGLDCLRRGTPESDEEARALFAQALSLSPGFARAYSGISLSHFNDWSCQAWDRWDERERLAFENARRAVELDDGDHVTHTILARIYLYRRDFERSERHLEHAVALNGNDADMLMHAAVAFAQLGDSERAVELMDRAFALKSVVPDWYCAHAGFVHFIARDLDAALAVTLRAPDGLVDTRALLAAICVHQAQQAPAEEHAARFMAHFRNKITAGREPERGEAARWLLHVNPMRRSSDADYFLAGVVGAGVDAP
jgi:DNA-binding SARP family transcriptional activator